MTDFSQDSKKKKVQLFRSCSFFIRYSLSLVSNNRVSDIIYSLHKFGLITKKEINIQVWIMPVFQRS